MYKKRIKSWVLLLFSIICIIGIIYSSYNIIIWKLNLDENNNITKKLDKNITVEDKKYNIDFKALKDINSDTVGYIIVNNTNINYVVVKGDNNDYYLKHNFEKKYNIAGWIFADYRNKIDETDKNLIIYGHNMRDGSMFETLINVLDKKWYTNKNNHKVVLVTEMGTYYYQVFSSYSIKPEEYYINTMFKDDNEFYDFITTLKSRSIYDYGYDVSKDDKILTLSSCIGDGSLRVVLHAKLIGKD